MCCDENQNLMTNVQLVHLLFILKRLTLLVSSCCCILRVAVCLFACLQHLQHMRQSTLLLLLCCYCAEPVVWHTSLDAQSCSAALAVMSFLFLVMMVLDDGA